VLDVLVRLRGRGHLLQRELLRLHLPEVIRQSAIRQSAIRQSATEVTERVAESGARFRRGSREKGAGGIPTAASGRRQESAVG